MLSIVQKLIGFFRDYRITPTSIWLKQRGHWMELRRDEISAVKFKNLSKVIVRYYGGQRHVVSLYGFSNPAYDVVYGALRDSMLHNEQVRKLWAGSKVFRAP